MKKLLLLTKTLLAAALLCVGQNAWGQVSSWTYNPSGSYTGGQEIAGNVAGIATITLGNGTWSVQSGTYYGIWTNSAGATSFTDNIPTNGTYLKIVPIKTMQMVLSTGSNNNYSTHVIEESNPTVNLYYNRPRYNSAITFTKLEAGKTYYFYGDGYKNSGDELRIQSYTLTSYEDYTIHYVDDSATPVTIKADRVVSGESLYGATVSAVESDLANIEYNENTYAYKSGNTPITLSTSGNEITLVFAKATAANVKVKYTANIADVETEIKDAVNIESAVGATVTATGENLPTYITYSDVKYKYSSGNNPLTVTGVAEDDVITLVYTPASIYSYEVNAYDGSDNKLADISSGSYVEGDAAVSVAYPRWTLSGTTLYSCGSGSVTYSTSFTPDADDYEKKITYNSGTVSNVVFYTEGEAVAGVSVGSNAARASKGQMGYTDGETAESYKDVTTLAPGKYRIYMRTQNGNSAARPYNFKVGENVVFTGSFANGTNTDANSDEFTVYENSTLSFASVGSSASGIDYFYVVKTGDATVSITPANAKSTYVTTYALDFTDVEGLDAYVATAAANGSVTLSEVGAVPAGTPLMLIGTASTEYSVPVVASASAPVVNMFVAGDGTTPFTGSTYDYILFSDGLFYQIGSGTVATNKAYLHCDSDPTAAAARSLRIVFDNITAVENVEAAPAEAKAKEGKFIENGKLVIVKNGVKYNAAGAQVK